MKVLILGGKGFIGHNLTKYLEEKGFDVTSTSSQGLDITNADKLNEAVLGYDAVVNLVGLSGVTATQKKPGDTVTVNTIGQLNLLEAVRNNNPICKVVFLSSRLEYGKVDSLPIDNNSRLVPNTIYGISKFMAAKYSTLYHKLYGIKTITLRVSNPFGPQEKWGNSNYNIINYFINSVLEKKPITLFGEGDQKRDYLYVDDLCEAIYLSLIKDEAVGKTINIGGGRPISISEIAKSIIGIVGYGELEYKPWPKEWSVFETGDSYFDLKDAKDILGWEPKTSIKEGLNKTVNYLKK